MKPTPPPGQTVRKRSAARTLGLVAAWFFGIPAALALVLYVALLIHPIPLPFISAQIRNVVVASMPPGTELELGDMALALENYVVPVIQFSPVVYKDTTTGAKVGMDALEVGFSPVRALIGQPGASVTIVGPHIQINQDLFGPRLADLEVVPDPNGGPDTVRVLEGSRAFPDAGIHSGGIDVRGKTTAATHMRSDNDWLVFNLEAAETGIASVIEQAEMGRFSRLIIKKGSLDMNDALYGVLRKFKDINLDIAPTPNGKAVDGNFSADFGGAVMKGIFQRVIDEHGQARLKVSLNNFDLGAFVPNINDTDSMAGLVGTSAVSLDIGFDPTTHKIQDGDFHIDMTGTDIRLDTDLFPIASNIIEVHWKPATGTFTMDEAALSVGSLALKASGVFVLGLDDLYGPTVGISMQTREGRVLAADGSSADAFDTMSFKGWSAPLYGAVGIDQAIVTKGTGARIESKGRLDMLRKGMGVDLTVAASGVDVADIKTIWPDFLGAEARAWFMKSVLAGKLETANVKLAFPVGTLALKGESKPIPQNGVFVEMVAEGIKVKPTDTLAPIELQGKARIQMHDAEVTLAADGGVVPTPKGDIAVANAALVMTPGDSPGDSIVEISGDVSSGIPALTTLIDQVQPGMSSSKDLPIDLGALGGNLNVRLVSTIVLDKAFAQKSLDYTVNGNVVDFASTAPIQGHVLSDGQLAFMATPAGFQVGGTAAIDGMSAKASVNGDLKDPQNPNVIVNAEVDLGDLAKLGMDTSQFATGKVELQAKPTADGAIDIAVDLKNADINIKDLGITKKAGTSGMLQATIKQSGDTTDLSNINIGFGDVRLKGSLEMDAKKGLQSAEFSNFALSPGDAAQISMTPINGGYQVRVRGDQLDLKPLLKRFFALDQGSAGPKATAFTQTIAVDLQLERALGFYKTTAYNVDLDLALKGEDLRKVSLAAQFSNGASLSVATNPTPDGKTLSVVFNDLGTVLRFANVYAQVQGGEGNVTLDQNTSTKVDVGQVNLRNFTVVDEKNLSALMNGSPIAKSSSNMVFNSAKVDFVHRVDRIQIANAMVTGESIGGSGNGFIYTDTKQYDLVGTFIPMFGINNGLGKLLGPFAGGAAGGLFGITFQVKGPLDKPTFKVNPMSALAPAPLRPLFEFRAKEQPRTDQ